MVSRTGPVRRVAPHGAVDAVVEVVTEGAVAQVAPGVGHARMDVDGLGFGQGATCRAGVIDDALDAGGVEAVSSVSLSQSRIVSQRRWQAGVGRSVSAQACVQPFVVVGARDRVADVEAGAALDALAGVAGGKVMTDHRSHARLGRSRSAGAAARLASCVPAGAGLPRCRRCVWSLSSRRWVGRSGVALEVRRSRPCPVCRIATMRRMPSWHQGACRRSKVVKSYPSAAASGAGPCAQGSRDGMHAVAHMVGMTSAPPGSSGSCWGGS